MISLIKNEEKSSMMITIVEGRVAEENWSLLVDAYQRGTQQVPPGVEQAFLVQGIEDREVWQMVTVWSGMPSLQQIQKSKEAGVTPRGVLIFREAHAETTHAVFEVVQHRTPQP
jgi:hypothetical protein